MKNISLLSLVIFCSLVAQQTHAAQESNCAKLRDSILAPYQKMGLENRMSAWTDIQGTTQVGDICFFITDLAHKYVPAVEDNGNPRLLNRDGKNVQIFEHHKPNDDFSDVIPAHDGYWLVMRPKNPPFDLFVIEKLGQ